MGKEDSTKVGKSRQKAMVSEAGERVPSNPWGTGLRMEYYSFVRKGLHFLVKVLSLLLLTSEFETGTWEEEEE